jgi:hypothetical protein
MVRNLAQAQRQLRASEGFPIVWHVAEEEMVLPLRKMFADAGLTSITVVYTPPIP